MPKKRLGVPPTWRRHGGKMLKLQVAVMMLCATLAGQSRPAPFPMVWDAGRVVSLDQADPFIETLRDGKLHRKDLPKLADLERAVDYQDGCLWINRLLPEEEGEVLPTQVERVSPTGDREIIGTLRCPYLRGTVILPLRNGTFIGCVRCVRFDMKIPDREAIGPIGQPDLFQDGTRHLRPTAGWPGRPGPGGRG